MTLNLHSLSLCFMIFYLKNQFEQLSAVDSVDSKLNTVVNLTVLYGRLNEDAVAVYIKMGCICWSGFQLKYKYSTLVVNTKYNIYVNWLRKGKSSEVWFRFQAQRLNSVLKFGNKSNCYIIHLVNPLGFTEVGYTILIHR